MDWVKAITEAFDPIGEYAEDGDITINPGATDAELAAITRTTGLPVPADLAAALKQANGIEIYHCNDLMNTLAITETHQDLPSAYEDVEDRSLVQHIPHLLPFHDYGTGDYDAYHIVNGQSNGIVRFDHETGEISPLAKDLAEWVRIAAQKVKDEM